MGATRLLGHLRRPRRASAPPSFSSSPFLAPNLLPPPGGGGGVFFWDRRRHYGSLPGRFPQHPFSTGRSSFRPFSSWHDSTGGPVDDGDAGSAVVEGSVTGMDLSSLKLDGSGDVEVVGGGESMWDAPVRAVISLLDGYQDFTGLPWWIIIASSTLAFRVSLLPVLILQLKKMGKFSELFPKLPPPLPPPFSGRSFQEQFLLFRNKSRELGCPSYLWNFAFITVQMPCFLLWMTSIRRMSLDNHPGFDYGGALWFHNLTEYPHGVLGSVFPLLIAGLHFINVQISFQTLEVASLPGLLGLLARYYKLYLDILSIPLLLIGFYVPQGSLVYWVTNSFLTLIQQLSLRNPYIRKSLGLPEINVRTEHKISKENIPCEKNATAEHRFSIEHPSPEELVELGLKHYAVNHHDKALELLRLANEKDPELARALIGMGQISYSRKLLTEAAEYFERAIPKIKEEEVGLLILASFGAGLSHIQQGKKSEGIEHLKRIVQLKEPENFMEKACYYQGFLVLGSTLFNEGEKSEAAKYLRIAATYDPGANLYLKQCEEG